MSSRPTNPATRVSLDGCKDTFSCSHLNGPVLTLLERETPGQAASCMKPGSIQCPETIEPERNLFCAAYEDCLDVAVEGGWKNFSCAGCQGYQPILKDEELWKQDERACMALLLCVFYPGLIRMQPARILQALKGQRQEEPGVQPYRLLKL